MNYLLIDSPFIFFPCTVVALNYSLLQTALFLMLLFLPSFLTGVAVSPLFRNVLKSY